MASVFVCATAFYGERNNFAGYGGLRYKQKRNTRRKKERKKKSDVFAPYREAFSLLLLRRR